MSAYAGRLVVYGQDWWHNPVFIIGNVAALAALRDACDRAIREDCASAGWFDHSDGEGYPVMVARVTDDVMDKAAVPYSDEVARDRNKDALWPHKLLSHEVTIRLNDEAYAVRGEGNNANS